MKRTIEITHGTLEVVSAQPGRIVFTIETNAAFALPAWVRMGEERNGAMTWLDGKYLDTTKRTVKTR